MRVLITSDTHGYYEDISNYVIEKENIDLILHAGDSSSDAISIAYETGVPCIRVRGNNDYFDNTSEDFELVDIGKTRILLTHGHKENVYRTYNRLVEKAKETGASIVVFGHTHTYYKKYHGNILLLNPGSPSLPRDGNAGFLIMDIGDKINIERINL